MSWSLTQLESGAWVDNGKGPGGSVVVRCDGRLHRRTCTELLGQYHFHGTFTPKRGRLVRFEGSQGGDYPDEVIAAMRPPP